MLVLTPQRRQDPNTLCSEVPGSGLEGQFREGMMRIAVLTGATVMGGLLLATLPVSIQWSAEKNLSISQDKAYAVVGRPATPGSVAGAHRRHSRRAVRRCAAGVTC
jgi:hypothetical protein